MEWIKGLVVEGRERRDRRVELWRPGRRSRRLVLGPVLGARPLLRVRMAVCQEVGRHRAAVVVSTEDQVVVAVERRGVVGQGCGAEAGGLQVEEGAPQDAEADLQAVVVGRQVAAEDRRAVVEARGQGQRAAAAVVAALRVEVVLQAEEAAPRDGVDSTTRTQKCQSDGQSSRN